MSRNVEIKASIPDIEAMEIKVSSIATEGPHTLIQDDTFFECKSSGRLKLRTFGSGHGELIFYQRGDQDQVGPKESFYVRSQTSQPAQMLEALTLAYGVVGRVKKFRTVYLIGRSRVHLDRLEDIGSFLEIEVVLADDESTESGVRTAHALLEKLGIAPAQLIGGAYVDMLTVKRGPA